MAKTVRTPPMISDLPQTSSEGDMTKLDPDNLLINAGKRQKRLRSDDHTENEPTTDLTTLLNNWKKDQDITLNRLTADMAILKQQNSNIQASTLYLEESMKFISKQYEDMKERVVKLENERTEHLNHIISLENKIDEHEKRYKSTVIEFRNIPLPASQPVRRESQQELCNIVQTACKTMKVEVHPSDIKDIFSIKTKTGSSTIITELNSTITRNSILKSAKELNKQTSQNKLSSAALGLPGPSVPIYVSESLTKKNRKLFAITREKAKAAGYKFVWSQNGRIYVRESEGAPR
ncbi:hypothetical protein O0L34_g19304 [Tuta absoluta]|nr:hypothetical protein O0L34_g19304 [Tuta absoluta]